MNEVDFKNTFEKANELLVSSSSIKTFPFSMKNFIECETDIVLLPYSEIEKCGFVAEELLCTNDAAILERNGEFIIFYNEKMPKNRAEHSLAHEIGHYFCGHNFKLIQDLRNTGSEKFATLYNKCEIEAHFFASQIRMPEQIIIELSKRGFKIDVDFLMKNFGVSEESAQKRLSTLQKVYDWKNAFRNDFSLDTIILEKFKIFINKIAPRKMSYSQELEKELEMEKERQSWY